MVMHLSAPARKCIATKALSPLWARPDAKHPKGKRSAVGITRLDLELKNLCGVFILTFLFLKERQKKDVAEKRALCF